MKTITTTIVLLCAVFSVSANDYHKQLNKSIEALLQVKENSNEYLALAHTFEDLSKTAKNDWLPPYYAALSNVWATFSDDNNANTDSILDHCTALLDRSESLGGDKSELLCIRSMVASAKIMVEPMTRGMKFGMLSTQFLKDAKDANPNNPRVYFVQAQSLIFIPEMFGGGCKNANPVANEAIEKYKTFVPKSEFDPNWGLAECIQVQKDCK